MVRRTSIFPFYRLVTASLFALSFQLQACSSAPYVWASEVPPERAKPEVQTDKIGRGDVLALTVVGQGALSGTLTVGTDGSVAVPNVGNIAVMGLTAREAGERIREQLSVIIKEPKVSVSLVGRFLEVTILGEVQSRGKFRIQSGDGVANAIAMAGGLTEFGHGSSIYLIRAGEPLRIRFRMRDLLSGGNSARSFALRDGDILVVE